MMIDQTYQLLANVDPNQAAIMGEILEIAEVESMTGEITACLFMNNTVFIDDDDINEDSTLSLNSLLDKAKSERDLMKNEIRKSKEREEFEANYLQMERSRQEAITMHLEVVTGERDKLLKENVSLKKAVKELEQAIKYFEHLTERSNDLEEENKSLSNILEKQSQEIKFMERAITNGKMRSEFEGKCLQIEKSAHETTTSKLQDAEEENKLLIEENKDLSAKLNTAIETIKGIQDKMNLDFFSAIKTAKERKSSITSYNSHKSEYEHFEMKKRLSLSMDSSNNTLSTEDLSLHSRRSQNSRGSRGSLKSSASFRIRMDRNNDMHNTNGHHNIPKRPMPPRRKTVNRFENLFTSFKATLKEEEIEGSEQVVDTTPVSNGEAFAVMSLIEK